MEGIEEAVLRFDISEILINNYLSDMRSRGLKRPCRRDAMKALVAKARALERLDLLAMTTDAVFDGYTEDEKTPLTTIDRCEQLSIDLSLVLIVSESRPVGTDWLCRGMTLRWKEEYRLYGKHIEKWDGKPIGIYYCFDLNLDEWRKRMSVMYKSYHKDILEKYRERYPKKRVYEYGKWESDLSYQAK